MSKVAVIGDVHGCGKSLKALLNKLKDCERIYSVGDLIDRGPNTPLVMDLVFEYQIKTVMGNHEWLMLTGHQPDLPNHENWLANGGDKTLSSYENDKAGFEKLLNYVKTLPYYFLIKDYLICHAGIPKNSSLEESTQKINSDNEEDFFQSLLWYRGPSYYKNHFVISGHTPYKKPILTKNYCNIDTGCVFKNQLTAITLPDKEIIQVDYME